MGGRCGEGGREVEVGSEEAARAGIRGAGRRAGEGVVGGTGYLGAKVCRRRRRRGLS